MVGVRSRLGRLDRLERHDVTEARTALSDVRGWSSQWSDTLTTDERLTLARLAVATFRGEDVSAEARPFLEAEREYVLARIGDHLADMGDFDRLRWRSRYLEAIQADATGSVPGGSESAGTGAASLPPGP